MKRYLRSFKGRLTLLVALAVFVPLLATSVILGARLSQQTRSLFASKLTASLETFTLVLVATQDNLVKGLDRMAADNTLAVTLDLRIVPQLTRYIGRQREVLGVSFLGVQAEGERSTVVVGAEDSQSISSNLVFDPRSDGDSGDCFVGRRPLQLMQCRGNVYLVATTPVEPDASTSGTRGDASAAASTLPLGHLVGGIRLSGPAFLENLRSKKIEHPMMWVGGKPILDGIVDQAKVLPVPPVADGTVDEYKLGATTYLAVARSLPIGSNSLVYASLAQLDFLNRAFAEMAVTVAGIGLLLFMATLAVLGLLVNRMAQPIRDLGAGADRIGAGELDHRIEIRSGEEFQALALSFNRMTGKLQESHANLEQMVAKRTHDLTEALQRLTALAEMGRTVNSTLDLQAVLNSIVVNAVRLTGTDEGTIYEYDETTQQFRVSVSCGMTPEHVAALRAVPLRLGEGAVGNAIASRGPVQVPDVLVPGVYAGRLQELAVESGVRALLAVPLMREDRIIGGLVVRRRTPGEFSSQLVDLLGTFAAQSALTIQNARLFREIAEKGRQLEAASQLKSQFLANMSHELRTPLNAIIGVTEMLHEDAVDLKREDELEPLDRVLRAAKHLLALINDILDLSKIEAGKMDIQIESFAIAPLINDVVQTIATMATKNGNEVVVDCAAGIGTMRADETRIRQALLNLASNANKFTEHGTVTIGARRGMEAGREWVTMAVTDTGIGLTPEQMEKLFQDFVQADASTTRKYGGTGLGLAISRRFCQMMGGDIMVASELGRGSTFTIRLPADVGAGHPPATSKETAAARPGVTASGVPTILVVDDDKTVREVMERHLAREGFAVVTAGGGHEGLRLAHELHPAAITLDVIMPDLDGWTVLATIKGDPELADIPVILVSIVDDKNRGYALGATDYMVKPVDRVKLSRALRSICGAAGRHALLVDDDDVMRRGMRQALEQDGWQVGEAENGRVALARLAESRPDIIMLDLMMPEMDGFEFLVEMRARAEWREIPVLVVTAKDLTSQERAQLNGDVERVLQKGSSELDELLREIGRVLPGSIERGRGKKAAEGAA